jgi:hypothetical protein
MQIEFKPVLKVSFSRIKTWRHCQMKHHYRYNEKLRKRKKPLFAFIGTALHRCIEEYQEGRDWTLYLKEFKSQYDRLFADEKEMLGDLPDELKAIMENYFAYYSNDGLTYPARRWGKRTEIEVKAWLDSETLFVGYIDAYPQDSEGRNWIMDHKSFKAMPDEDSRFSDYQFVVYYWLLPQLGYPKADGIIWDYLRKKAPVPPEPLKSGALSKAKNQDTTVEVYMAKAVELFGTEKAEEEYGEFARETFSGREDRFFRRVYLPQPPDTLVDNIVIDLKASIEEIRSMGPISRVRNMSRECKQCEYYNLCSAELRGLDTDFMRKFEYTVKGEEDDQEEVPNE